ncbi:MAG: DUF111 family protein [Chloracidobacterium sp.]|nr:DUF111 family protein [Chloracidobacterium sp.]
MRTLYFDCFAGASGNMILGALIAAGVHAEGLKTELRKLQISEFDIEVSTVDRSGITSTHVDVRVPHEHVHRHLHNIVDIIDRTDLSDSVKSRSRAIFTRLAEAGSKDPRHRSRKGSLSRGRGDGRDRGCSGLVHWVWKCWGSSDLRARRSTLAADLHRWPTENFRSRRRQLPNF